jgi:hypothetical protein
VIYRQFIEEDIKDEVSEGFIRNAINKAASKFIQNALADEIEKGKELEKNIKAALDGLDKGFEEIKKKIDTKANSKSKLAAIEQVKDAIKAVQSQTFDTLTMIGSEGEIDFAGFMGSASVAAAVNFGILFSPIRSVFMTRKAYKYFLGIIKQTIRRNLLVIQLNFDQFENLILQKSFESEEDSESITKSNTLHEIISAMTTQLCSKDSKLKIVTGTKGKEMKEYLEAFRKAQDIEFRQHRENYKNNPLRSLWEDQHNNTYTRTLEQIKQYINDDSQKELDALKNSITKMAGNDVDLIPYGELLISAAEEYAVHTNHGINNNFIKMSSVFNLENQKKLIDLIVATQAENESEIKKKEARKFKSAETRKLKKAIKDGKKLYEDKLKDSKEDYTFDKFNDEFSDDDISCLKAFFQTDEGKDPYKKLIEDKPLYKYLLDDTIALNALLETFKKLKIVKIDDIDDFYKHIVKKDQSLYYMMAESSIEDAIEHRSSKEKYFGFVTESDVDKSNGTLIEDLVSPTDDKLKQRFNNIFNNIINIHQSGKYRSAKEAYFLIFEDNGEGLFNILHNDFKTKIFDSKGNYENDISLESKETIMKIIYKNLKIGNSISTQFAKYLIRLEAHMMLNAPEKSWFVVEDNTELEKHFDKDSEEISNKNAFVKILQDDYEDIQKFLTRYRELAEKDFDTSSESDDKKEEK